MRRIVSLVAALALTLSLAAPSLAATEGTTSETLTLQTSTTLTGVPASISWGTGFSGQRTTTTTPALGVATDNPKGFTLSVAIANLTNGGTGSIAATGHRFTVAASPTSGTIQPGTVYASAGNYPGPAGSASTLASSTAAASGTVNMTGLTLSVPAGSVPGNYTGSMTFSLAENP